MTAIELEAGKQELIKDILSIDSAKTLESFKKLARKLLPKYRVEEDDTLMTKEEFFAKIDEAREQIRQGKYTLCRNKEEIRAFFDSL